MLASHATVCVCANNDFTMANLAQGIEEAHDQGKKLYVATNIAPHNAKIKTFIKDMEPVVEMGPDALIMSDPGLMMLIKEKWARYADTFVGSSKCGELGDG